MTEESIRSIRLQLARALREARPGDDEAILQLQRALEVNQASPPDWEILAEMGDALLGRGDRPGALVAFVKAAAASSGSASKATDSALALLSGEETAELAAVVPDEDVGSLLSAVNGPAALPHSVYLLAARLLAGRRQLAESIQVLTALVERGAGSSPAILGELASALIETGRPDEALQYLEQTAGQATSAETLLRAWALLDTGRFEDALRVAVEVGPRADSTPAVRALALFGLGRSAEALSVLADAPPSRDAALAQALVLLDQASENGTTLDPVAISAANDATILAARLEPAHPDVLLLRAQVALEGCLDVEEGRRLLNSALERRRTPLSTSRWLRIQERTRSERGWFQYFQTELAATAKDDPAVVELAARVQRGRTAYAHDAALDMLVAEVHMRRSDPYAAAEAYGTAALSYDQANDLAHAVTAARSSARVGHTPKAAVDLAEYLWRLTYEQATATERDSSIAEGLACLSALEAEIPGDLVGRAAVVRGLLHFRAAEFLEQGQVAASWTAVVPLLLAVLLQPDEAYWSAHLARALDRAYAPLAAYHFAKRAYGLDQSSFVVEVLLITRTNYHGFLDAETEELAKAFETDPDWRDTMLLMATMLDGKLRSLDQIPTAVFDGIWGRDVEARAYMLLTDAASARDRLLKVLAEAEKSPARLNIAADMSALLGEFDRARDLIKKGVEIGETTPESADYNLAYMDLIESDGRRGSEVMEANLKTRSVPFALRSAMNIDLPLIPKVPGCPPGAAAAGARLIEVARARLEELETPPPIASDAAGAPDEDTREMVGSLLEIAELIERQAWKEARARLGELAIAHPVGLTGLALSQLESTLEGMLAVDPIGDHEERKTL